MDSLVVVSVIALWILVLLLGLSVLIAFSAISDLADRVQRGTRTQGAMVGERIMDLELANVNGEQFRLSDVWFAHGAALVLVSTGCSACHGLLLALSGRMRQAPEIAERICVVCVGSKRMASYFVENIELPEGLRVADISINRFQTYFKVEGTPTILHIDHEGIVTQSILGFDRHTDLNAFLASLESGPSTT